MRKIDSTGIVVIDMQEDFVSEDSVLVEKQKKLFDAFRGAGMKAYVIDFEGEGDVLPDVYSSLRNGYSVCNYGKLVNSCFKENVIDRSNDGKISLDNKLKKDGIKNLVFTGVYGDMCVYDSMNDAVKLGYNCFTSPDLNKDFGDGFGPEDYKLMGVKYFENIEGLIREFSE